MKIHAFKVDRRSVCANRCSSDANGFYLQDDINFKMYIKMGLHSCEGRIQKDSCQAKSHQKCSFLFWLPNMAIICEYVHRLELRSIFKFRVAVAT